MFMFDGFIVRGDCVVNLEAVKSHPNVKLVRCLPRDWILYEFHHELFKDPDFMVGGIWRQKMERFPDLRQSVIAMRDQQRALLTPWYEKKKTVGDANALIPTEQCTYRVSTLTPMRWIEWEPLIRGWDLAKQFTLKLHMKTGTSSTPTLSKLLEEWTEAGRGELDVPSGMESEDEELKLKVKCKQNGGPWLASLWVLLSDSRLKAGVRRMAVVDLVK